MQRKILVRFSTLIAIGVGPSILVAGALACLVPAGCTSGPHPPAAVTPTPKPDPKDAKDRTSGPHPRRLMTSGPHPGTGS